MGNRINNEEFIKRCSKIHNNKYNYDMVECLGSFSLVKIICPIHGMFEQTMSSHMHCKQGCPKCAIELRANDLRSSNNEFIEKSKRIHGDKYDYSLVDYKQCNKVVIIICKIHGQFKQRPSKHSRGTGCPKCSHLKSSSDQMMSTDCLIVKFNEKHGDRYDYSKVIYTGSNKNIEIICKMHGPFTQRASHHMRGCNCPSCVKAGFDPNKSAILYYVKIGEHYKIGITNKTLKARYKGKYKKITVIKEWLYDNGRDAYDKEQEIVKKYKQYKFTGINEIYGVPSNEMFVLDILKLDKEVGNGKS